MTTQTQADAAGGAGPDNAHSYDASLRRDTALAGVLRARIEHSGPIPVDAYASHCLLDPIHGYYTTRQVFGAGGDFVTAPDISQIFGELIGAWVAAVWQQLGKPVAWRLIELGPGRGTLMADAARVFARVDGLVPSLQLQLVEASEKLAAVQRTALAGSGFSPTWSSDLPPASALPTVIIANEYLDCLMPQVWVGTPAGWQRRAVAVDASGSLQFMTLAADRRDLPQMAAQPGVIVEIAPAGTIASWLRGLATAAPLAALFVDYGHEDGLTGDTLQAVRGHRYEHPLTSPGEADLTVQVRFGAYRSAFEAEGLAVEPLLPQGEFLGRLGAVERASRLMAANPAQAAMIEAGVARLLAPAGMGGRVQVMGVRSAALEALPGF